MSWSEAQIDAVWNKGLVVEEYDPNEYRQDACNAWIARREYGKQSNLGWEIDHVFPESRAREFGYPQMQIDDIKNLRPMHWENNRSKNDNYPSYVSVVTSRENKNIVEQTERTVNGRLIAQIKNLFSWRWAS